MKEQLKTLISEGKTAQAIKQLLAVTSKEPDLHNEVVHLSGRYEKYKKAGLQERITFEQEGVSFAKIDLALINIIDSLGGIDSETEIKHRKKGGSQLNFEDLKAGKDIKVKAKQNKESNGTFSAKKIDAGGSINFDVEQN